MNKIEFYGAGFPFENKTVEFLEDSYNAALSGIAGIGGSGNFIISGMVQTGNNISEGWIYYNGELIYFEAGVKADTFIIEETVENKNYQDGVSHRAYITRHAKFGVGTSPIAFSTLKRLPNLLDMQSLMASVINFETSIIIDGCAITNVSIAPTTLDISAGLVMIDNNVIKTLGYTGNYPVWINADGLFVNAQPAAGSFIKFDPYTSQHKSSVIRRATYRTGDVLISAVLSDRFDNTGLGRWEMQGFALMNGANGALDIRGRSPLAYDGRGADPAPGDASIWDANYNNPGNFGGEKKHKILKAELPAEGLEITSADGVPLKTGAETPGVNRADVSRNDVNDAAGPIGYKTENMGSGTLMENRHPYMVLVFAQRI